MTLEELQLRAMRALVAELTQKTYTTAEQTDPRQHAERLPRRNRIRRSLRIAGAGATLQLPFAAPFSSATAAGATASMRLAVEEDFGRELIEARRRSLGHEPSGPLPA